LLCTCTQDPQSNDYGKGWLSDKGFLVCLSICLSVAIQAGLSDPPLCAVCLCRLPRMAAFLVLLMWALVATLMLLGAGKKKNEHGHARWGMCKK
jgi:hypothetical protein